LATQIDPATGLPTGVSFVGTEPGWVDNIAGGADIIEGDYPGHEGMLLFAGLHQGDTDTVFAYDLDVVTQDPWVDVPWVSEVPISDTVAPYADQDVDVVFDSTGLTVGECYTAALGIFHDDPGWDSPFMVPLELCIVSPEFTFTKTVEPMVAHPGDVVTYTLTAGNDGDAATGVTITDLLPDGIEYISSTPPGDDSVPGQVTWNVDLGAGESLEFIIVGTVSETIMEPVVLTNTAALDWFGIHVPDTAPLEVMVAPLFDLAKEAAPATAFPGDLVTFTITFNNTGDPVGDVMITDELPEGVTFVSATGGGIYSSTLHAVMWDGLTVGSEDVVATVVVEIGATTAPGILTNTVTLDWMEVQEMATATFEVLQANFYYYLPLTFKNN
ncbi:MAG: DUF11 domain-containing protein, partial [Anaerolineae bacterium]|nr:DUF11 domain-containing protein [Anaerolineae bacterium]